jgi:hypothetical protein
MLITKNKVLLFSFFSLLSVEAMSQETLNWNGSDQKVKDTIHLEQDSISVMSTKKLDKLAKYYDNYTSEKKKMDGFRIEVYSGSGANSKQKAREKQLEFRSKFPDIPANLVWSYPNFEINVGNFRSKVEAEGALIRVQKEYPFAFVKKDMIDPPDLDRKKKKSTDIKDKKASD